MDMVDKEEEIYTKPFLTSLAHYAIKEKCRFTMKLREKTNGYENNDDNTVKRTKNQREDYIKKYKDTLYEDEQTEMKLRRMDIIYRLYYTEDAKLRKLMLDYKNLVRKIGIDIQKQDDHSEYQHNLRCVGYYQGIYKMYKEAQLRPDESYLVLMQMMKKDYEPKYKLESSEDLYHQLLSLFYTVEDMQKQIMQSSIYDEKEENKTKLIKEYKIVDDKDNQIDYNDSYSDNLQENILEFRFGYDLFDEFRSDEIVQIRQKEKLNYVKEFYDRYEDVLKAKSPDFWQFLLFDILKVLCNKNNTDEQLQELLINLLDDFDACRFLLTNRKEIILYLYKNHFAKEKQFSSSISSTKTEDSSQGLTNYEILKAIGMKDIDIERESKLGLKKRDLDSKVSQAQSKNSYDVDDEFSEIDFIKQEQSQLVQKIPTLEKNDYPEYIQLKISPMPRHHVPPADLVKIEGNFPVWAQEAFGSIQSLNVVQSKVYKTAFQTDDNILICAPTGAGKTNIALMTVLREVEKHINPHTKQLIDPTFKIIYISPMKALASEIVDKFSGMLKHTGVKCKELTGDMQLTKREIEETQIIVTTPEKWDVFTRKKNEVAETLRLLIIDEIHLLNDERGPVLECLVSRTLQNIERQQKSVRMLGLSATLPNYLDVASFLHVKKEAVFFFDATFRPVPLMQRYIGVREPKQSGFKVKRKKIDIYNDLCYQISKGILEHKKQVLIFVHSRKETIMTASYILKRAQDSQDLHLFKPVNCDKHSLPKIKDKELQKLAPHGLGFHHAGMLRKDRNIVEKMFNDGSIRILVATATLAWGVNLPAYGVIIKGTDVYDPSRGGTQDISVLDIQQMFGRAGRPQFDNNGEATLITDINKLNSFVAQLNNASFIESRFTAHLKEALNAEIALGNIATLKEAFDWVNYTFYAIRLRRNPMGYGCKVTQNKELSIEMHITETIESSLEHLDKLRLIRWDRQNNYLASTELGRITSHYYINCDTMNTFCKGFGISLDNNEDFEENEQKRIEYKTDLGILKIIAQAKEFENIKMRPEETEELALVIKKYWIFDEQIELNVKRICSTDNNTADNTLLIDTPEKILALISGYLCKYQYENFSLISDSMFVIQNSIRLLRCMLDIVNKKCMADNSQLVSRWCKNIEQRLIPDESPLHQFCKSNWQGYNSFKQRKENRDGFLSEDVVAKIDDREISLDNLREMPATELAHAIAWNTKVASVIKKFVCYIPRVEVEYTVRPIAQTVLKVDVFITPKWSWSNRWHSKSELFNLTVDDENEIMHHESFTISQQQVFSQTPTEISFFVPFRDSKVPYYRLVVQHDTWVNQPETEVQINLENIYFQGEKMEYTELLDLHPLPTSALNNPEFEKIYKMKFFNPNQTQIFHAMYNTDHNILIGSPTGSGKTIMSEFSALRVFNMYPGKKVIYVAPLKAIAKERLADWEVRFGQGLGKTVLELTGDYTPDMEALLKADVLITTPEKWDGISRNWNNRSYVQNTGLVIFDEIHLLGQDRGPVLEVIVSRMNLISSKTGHKVRMVGLSTAMANGTDVADWFGVPKNYFFNFRPHVRPVPLKIYFDGFSAKAYCPRMAEMNKPAFQQIRKFGDKKPVLVFVSSRRQTRLTALDLIAHAMHDIGGGQSPFVMCQEEELQIYLENIKDEYLKQTISFGIGMHHAGLDQDDRKIVEQLFLAHKIQVLVATSTLAWGVNLPARLVIIKGTEFFDPKTKRYVDMPVTDILQMIGRAGRPQFDDKGIACVFVEQSKKNFYRKYLNDPFPIESSLISQIHDHFNAEIACGTIQNKQQCMDWITWTYFFRRMLKNPTYYNLDNADTKSIKKFLIELVDECMNRLADHGCITIDEELKYTVTPTFLGQLAAFYYIKHESIHYFDKNLNQNITIPELLRVLSYSKEFEEIPLRHNEENYNEALSKICPLKCDKSAFNSSNEKTFLLYQVHLFRLPPPIRDYLTDAKIVIDSSIRILSAMIDLAAEKRLLNTCINLCMIMQMIMQAVWFDQSPLINIPHFDNQIIKKLGIVHFCQLIEEYKNKSLRTTLKKIDNKKFSDERTWKEIEEAIKTLPDISLRARIFPFDSEKLEKQDTNLRQSDIQLSEGGEAIVQVFIEKENPSVPLKVHVQKTGKIKDASWWVLIGDEYTGKLHALKKVFFKNTLKKDIQVSLPSSFETSKKLTVFLISDSYLGLDQVYSLNLRSKDLKNDDKYKVDSEGSDDDIPKPIRQRLSDDENDKEKKSRATTHLKYQKGNALKKNKERADEVDSNNEEKQGQSTENQNNESQNNKESPNKKKNIISKKNNDNDDENNQNNKEFDRKQGNALAKKNPESKNQYEKKDTNQNISNKKEDKPKEKKEYVPKKDEGNKQDKEEQNQGAKRQNRDRKPKYNERRKQSDDEDEYDVGYKTKEGSHIDEFTRKRREEKQLDQLESKNQKEEDDEINQKIKEDSDFSDEDDDNQRKFKNKRGAGSGQGFSRGGGNKVGNQLRKRNNDDDYQPRGDRDDTYKKKQFQGDRKFNNPDQNNQNRGEKQGGDNDRKQYEKKYEKKETVYQVKEKIETTYDRKDNQPQQQNKQKEQEQPPKQQQQPQQQQQQQQKKPEQTQPQQQQDEQKKGPPPAGFKLRRKNSNEYDDEEKKNSSNNNNNRGGKGGYNQKR